MLYYLNKDHKSELNEVKPTTLHQIGWLEDDLEKLIAQNIEKIVREDQLLVFHQQRKRQEEPDIMAIDKNGGLYIFELKRWKSKQENLLQVLRYGQKFGQYDYSSIEYLFQNYLLKYGKKQKVLQEAHKEYFELEDAIPKDEFNKEQKFIVVTSGVDRETKDAIDYWGKKGLPIKALPYQVYKTKYGKLLLEITSYSPEGDLFMDLADGLVVVNTNYTYMEDVWQEMLNEEKASAYYTRKAAVKGVSAKSPIALYHTGVGIIAIGKTKDTYRRKPFSGDPDEEYYLPCEFEYKVDPFKERDKAVKAREINDFLDASYRFRQTCFTLPEKCIDFVRKTFRQKITGDRSA